jgi:hypothetical protein
MTGKGKGISKLPGFEFPFVLFGFFAIGQD